MNISVKGDYALHAIFDLSSQPPGQPVKIADIAQRQHIPQKFLELILASLKQGGFVESRRGAEGGYLLARAPHQITIGEVYRFFEGGQSAVSRSKRRADSPFDDLWRQVDEAVSMVVDHTTFADLLRTWTEKQDRFVPNWEI
jgi:Rrf2 family cysteine metabolism transcriptional repressor